ncbi:MAG: MraY family glycosyltransferase [Atribacterota bacterium]
MSILILPFSFAIAFGAFRLLVPRLKAAGIVGKDMNKPGHPEVPEMGGLGIIIGLTGGLLLAIALKTFTETLNTTAVNADELFAVLAMVLLIGLIGIIDDLLHIRQLTKALTPLFAALPLAAIRAGHSIMRIPFIGPVEFDIFYPLLLVPIAVTVAANAVNMLAGFNGLEVGMGLIATVSLGVIAYTLNDVTALLVLAAAAGALLAALIFNWYPARVFIGDVGTLSIGAVLASAVIIGDFETAGIIILVPYAVDFLLKAVNHFPKSFGEYNNGKLYCPQSGPVGLCQLVMKINGGISERGLVFSLIGLEAVFGVITVLMYARF